MRVKDTAHYTRARIRVRITKTRSDQSGPYPIVLEFAVPFGLLKGAKSACIRTHEFRCAAHEELTFKGVFVATEQIQQGDPVSRIFVSGRRHF